MAENTAQAVERHTLEEIHAWKGHRLDEIGGATVGKVEGVFVDAETGDPEWVLARMGRFGKRTLVPARDAVEGVGHVWVPYSRDVIRGAPKVDPAAALTASAERSLLGHYGVAGPAGRAAQLDDREREAVSARPAETG
jgi:PRC-barrel domain